MALSSNERSVVDAYLAYRVRSEANVDTVTSPSSRDGTTVPAGAFAGVSSACSRLGSKALISQSRLLEAQLATMKVEEEKEELEIETLRLERARVVRTAEFLEQRAVECENFKRSVERLLAEAKAEVRDAQRRNVTGSAGLGGDVAEREIASKLFTTNDAPTVDGLKTETQTKSLTSGVDGGERKPYIISFEHHDKASGLTGHADPHALGVGVEDDKGRQNTTAFGAAQSPVFVTTSETLARTIEEAKVVDALAAGCDVSPVVAYPAILEAIGREARALRRADAYAATAEHAKAEAEESAVELRRAVAARSRDLLPQSQSLQNHQNQQNPQNAKSASVLGSASVTNASSVGVGGVAAGAFGPKTVSRAVSEAQQKLEEAQREAFAARKRLLMTHKRLLGTERLPTGAVLPLSATVDVVAGIRRELAVGRLDTLHRLGATDCSDLMHLAENINGPAPPTAATNPSASASRLGENDNDTASATGGLRRQQTGPLDSRQGTTVDGSYVGSAVGGDAASSSFHGSSSVHATSDERRVGALPDNFALRAQQLGSATKAAQQAALFGVHSSPATPGGGSNPPNLSSPSAAFPTSRGTIPISQAADLPRKSEFTTGSGLPAPSGSASHAMALPPPAQPMRAGAIGRSGAPPQVTSQGIVSSNASSVANEEGQDRVRRQENDTDRGRPMRDVSSSHATAEQQRPGGVMTSEIFSQRGEVAAAQERRGSGAGGDATRSMLQSFLRSREAPPQ